jgi:hypothetical protein
MGLPERVRLAAFVFLASDPVGSRTRIEQGLVFHFVSWLNLLTTAAGTIHISADSALQYQCRRPGTMSTAQCKWSNGAGALRFWDSDKAWRTAAQGPRPLVSEAVCHFMSLVGGL